MFYFLTIFLIFFSQLIKSYFPHLNCSTDKKSLTQFNNKKESFLHLGDDLIEVILGYLPFEDKFRFESVSKQFQRLIFNRIYTIDVSHQKLSSLPEPFYYWKSVDIETLEQIFKKCQNIRRVVSAEDLINTEEVFISVIENCSKLYEIQSDFEDLSYQTIKNFCTKFGPFLKKMNFIPNNLKVKQILKTSPKLVSIGYDWAILEDFFDGDKILVNNLKSFAFYYFSTDIKRISQFVRSNRNTIRSLELVVYDKTLTTSHTKLLFQELFKLSALRSLGIYYYIATDNNFVEFVQDLSNVCPNLSKLNFDLRINNSLDILKVYKSLNNFRCLKSIDLKNHCTEHVPLIPILSNSLKDCKNLLQLKISGNTFTITDKFFALIHKNFPRLSTLQLTNAHISAKALNNLGKMFCLRSISLISLSYESTINELDILELIRINDKIRSIYLFNSNLSFEFDQGDVKIVNSIPKSDIDLITNKPYIEWDLI